MIIDCHTHWGTCWEDKYGTDPSAWLEVMDKHGVGKVFLMGLDNMSNLSMCRAGNDSVAQVAAKMPDRFFTLGSSWPQMGSEGIDEVHRCIENLGMKGLKFHPWAQGFSTANPVFGEMCALAGKMNVPVIFHDGTPCYCLSEQIGGLARRFPGTKFVLGHSGILWNWRSALEAARLPNVWICLCGPHMRAIEILCRGASHERILWGTDFGFGFTDSVEYRLELINRARIAPALREKILGENPLRLLG